MKMLQIGDSYEVYAVSAGDDNELRWEQTVKTPYILICILNYEAPSAEKFEELLSRVESRLEINVPYVFDNGKILLKEIDYSNTSYNINTSGVAAGAFAAAYDENNELLVYALKGKELADNFRLIRTSVTVSCVKQTDEAKGGLFRRMFGSKENITYYEVTLETRGVYRDGDVYYLLNGYKYPVPKEAVGKNKTFYIKSKGNDGLKFGARNSVISLRAPLQYTLQ